MYDYRYDDEDTVFNEIEEFYSYVEVPQVAENMKAWQGSFSGGAPTRKALCAAPHALPEWIKSSLAQRKAHIEFLLESLEHRDAEIRFTNARRLLYVLQGRIGFYARMTRLNRMQEPSRKLLPQSTSCIGLSKTASWYGTRTASTL